MNSMRNKPWLSSYEPGVPESIGPVTETLCDMLELAAASYRGRPALDFLGKVTTFEGLAAQIDQVAEGLRALGVSRGDRVALIMPNCPQLVVATFATYRLGAIIVPHNPLLTEGELRRQFDDHGARVAIVWNRVAHTTVQLAGSTQLEHVISVDLVEAMPLRLRAGLRLPFAANRRQRSLTTVDSPVPGTVPWSEVATSGRLDPAHPAPSLDDIAAILYSGGTTGTPRGVMLSHRNLRANAMQGVAWMPDVRPGEEVMLSVLPLFHAYGLTLCLHVAISIGARIMLFPRYSDRLVLQSFRRARGTLLAAIPPIFSRLAKAAAAQKVDISSIRFSISGAMQLPDEITREWEKVTGRILAEGYGLTETSPIALTNPFTFARRSGTIGIPFPSTEIRVRDLANPSKDVPFDEEGELLIRGPQVFVGYWNRPQEAKQQITHDGWLRTGDIVRMSKDGFVTMVDRVSEVISSAGFNVSPAEVESIVARHETVRAVAVVGLPNAEGGDDVTAVIELEPGAELDAESIKALCREHLVVYKVPRQVVVVDQLPRSALGDVLRRVVRDELMHS